MDNHAIAEAAGLTWRYLDSATQENHTHRPDRELTADTAELYTEDGGLLLGLTREPEAGGLPAYWSPSGSELLSRRTLFDILPVFSPEQVSLAQLLDAEADDARWVPGHHGAA